jgi:hypothetical protein
MVGLFEQKPSTDLNLGGCHSDLEAEWSNDVDP